MDLKSTPLTSRANWHAGSDRIGHLNCATRQVALRNCFKTNASNLSLGTWCSGITSALHAEGPGFNPQCVHRSLCCRSSTHCVVVVRMLAPGQDSLAEWSKALAQGASPQGRGFEPHSCHFTRLGFLCGWRISGPVRDPDRAHGVVVSHPLSMREALGSIPSVSSLILSGSAPWLERHKKEVQS